jgi:hypothetical protein
MLLKGEGREEKKEKGDMRITGKLDRYKCVIKQKALREVYQKAHVTIPFSGQG